MACHGPELTRPPHPKDYLPGPPNLRAAQWPPPKKRMPPPAAQAYDYAPPSALDISGDNIKPPKPAATTAAVTVAPRYEGLVPIRMLAAFFVILNHTTYSGLKNAPQSVSDFMAAVNDMAWRVPFFLMLAGFLYARSTQGKGIEKMRGQFVKSARRVLILLAGWSVLYLANPPLKALLHWNVPAISQHYATMMEVWWPSMLWLGPSYHLWFLASMAMVWLFLGGVSTIWAGLRGLVDDRSIRPLFLSLGIMLASGATASLLPKEPVSTVGQVAEVLVVHLLFPCSFVLMGAALWHQRHWLTKPAVLVTMLALGTLLLVAEAGLGLGLDGPGPRNLSASGLCLALAAFGFGMRLSVKTLSPLWNLSPGIYCAHMLVINRLEPLFVNVDHWSSTLLLACATFFVSLGLCHVLSRFEWSSRFVK